MEVKVKEAVIEVIEEVDQKQKRKEEVNKEMEKVNHGEMEEEVYVQGGEETPEHNTIV